MKKIFFFLFSLILLTGCQMNTPSQKPEVPTIPTKPAEAPQVVEIDDLRALYPSAILQTNYGDIEVSLYSEDAPMTVNNFLTLSSQGFYDGTRFHRVIKDFMIQGGDPLSKDEDRDNDGTGGPSYTFKDEINDHKLVEGSLAMANRGPNTNGSQFFIVTATSTPWLDGKHTAFGHVINGMDVVKAIDAAKTDRLDRPEKAVILEKVILIKK